MKSLIAATILLLANIYQAQNVEANTPASSCPTPKYPPASRRLEEEGTVILKFLVGSDGKVRESIIQESSGHKRLDQAALEGLKNCKFQPKLENGAPTEIWRTMRFTWRLVTKDPVAYDSKPSVYKLSNREVEFIEYLNGKKVKFFEFTGPDNPSLNCRLGKQPLYRTLDQQPIEKFIENAFNEEAKHAGLYSEEGIAIKGEVKSISVSTYAAGFWEISLKITGNNNNHIIVEHRVEFETAITDSVKSCTNAATILPSFIQQTIFKVLKNENFNKVISD